MDEEKSLTLTPMMMVARLSKRFRDLMRRTGERAGVPDRYHTLLRHLMHRDGRTQQELATLTFVAPPSVSATLQQMEREGYITREPDRTDRRIVRVFLTEKGKSTEMRMHACADAYDAKLMEGISDEARAVCMEVLIKMRENLCALGEETA